MKSTTLNCDEHNYMISGNTCESGHDFCAISSLRTYSIEDNSQLRCINSSLQNIFLQTLGQIQPQNRHYIIIKAVSYTHLTLPTKRIV